MATAGGPRGGVGPAAAAPTTPRPPRPRRFPPPGVRPPPPPAKAQRGPSPRRRGPPVPPQVETPHSGGACSPRSDRARCDLCYDGVHQSTPGVAIVCLDADQAKALQLIGQVAAEHPEVPILAVSGRNDGQAILQALRNGDREFLTTPVQLEELFTALQRLPRRLKGSDSAHGTPFTKINSQVYAVLGSRGGVGCTSLAVNLGASLAQHPEYSVALIDLDLALGDADVALDMMGDYTLADVALNIDRLDMNFLKRSPCQHASGMSLLPHPVQLEDCQLIHEGPFQRLIGLLKASYTHLILDLSKGFTSTDATALRMADVILLVAQLELSSLR